jgi:hypothetical protein
MGGKGNEGGQSFARFSKSLARRRFRHAASQPARCPDLPVSTYRCSGRGDLRCPCLTKRSYPRVGFIVTNLARPAERIVAFYNQRGTAEQWIKEAKAQSNGPGCHAAPSPPTPSASSFMR